MTDHPTTSIRSRFLLVSLVLTLLVSACSMKAQASTDGKSESTPKVTQNASGSANNNVVSVTPTPAPCLETKGTVEDINIPSETLDEDIQVKIYLPPCYSFNKGTQYSVLYMLHGQTSQDDQWVRIGLLSRMDELLQQGEINPFIIVLPNEVRSNVEAFESTYGDAIVNDVIPYMDKNFNTCDERVCRAIGGLSRGGNWAIHLGFEHPELFTAVGAHSAPLFYGEILNVTRAADDPMKVDLLPVIYIDVGNRDEDHDDVIYFLITIQDLPVQYQFNEFLGSHNEEYWSAHAVDYLLFYNSQLVPPHEK